MGNAKRNEPPLKRLNERMCVAGYSFVSAKNAEESLYLKKRL